VDEDAVGWVIRMGLGVGMGRKLGSLELETCSAGLLLLDWTAGALRCAALRFAAPPSSPNLGELDWGHELGLAWAAMVIGLGANASGGLAFGQVGLVRLVNSGLVWLFISLRFRVGAGAGTGTGAVAAGQD
jgi:hypothetical protein